MQLGDEEAHYLGLNVRKTKFILLLLSAILIGCAVALSGVIGFVGLVVPHLIRMRLGSNHIWLLPATLLGSNILLAADTLSRTFGIPCGNSCRTYYRTSWWTLFSLAYFTTTSRTHVMMENQHTPLLYGK